VGSLDGAPDGCTEGSEVGCVDGMTVGCRLGCEVGWKDGCALGLVVGCRDDWLVGTDTHAPAPSNSDVSPDPHSRHSLMPATGAYQPTVQFSHADAAALPTAEPIEQLVQEVALPTENEPARQADWLVAARTALAK
jgi:hypothetical protein